MTAQLGEGGDEGMKTSFVKSGWMAAILLATLWLTTVPARAQSGGATGVSPKAAGAEKGGKTFTGEIWDSINAQRGSRDQMMKENSLTTPLQCTLFAVHYSNPPAKYVLYDVASKKIYQLDDQDQVQPYAAEKVKITGTYDEATHTIHVMEIQPGS
jgi:hypothetical protein